MNCCFTPPSLAGSPLFEGITGPRLWQVLHTLAGFGLIDLTGSASNVPAVPACTRWYVTPAVPVVLVTPVERDAYLTLAAGLLLRAAAAKENGVPEDPAKWPIGMPWNRTPFMFSKPLSLARAARTGPLRLPPMCCSVGRYQQAQGLYLQADTVLRAVLALRVAGAGGRPPGHAGYPA